MLKGECKKLFLELKDFSDNEYAIKDFTDLVKEFVNWNRGDIRLAFINLHNYGFPHGEMFIAYDNMGGYMNTTIYKPFEFIELMIDTFNEYDDENYLEDFWISRLKKLIKTYDF